MKYIYMNEHIKEKDPEDPVICVFDPNTNQYVYANAVTLKAGNGDVIATIRYGKTPKNVPHEIKAWVEVYDGCDNIKVDCFE